MKAAWVSVESVSVESVVVALVLVLNHRHIDTIRRHCKATTTAHRWRKGRKTHPMLRLRCQGPRRIHCNFHKPPASGVPPESSCSMQQTGKHAHLATTRSRDQRRLPTNMHHHCLGTTT